MGEKIKKAGPVIGVVLLITLWGSYAAAVKTLLKDLDNYQMLFYTFLFSSIVLTAVTCIKGLKERKALLTAKQLPALIFPGVLCFGYYFFYNHALSAIPAVQASILNYTFPLWMIGIYAIMNRKKPRISTVIAMVSGFAGVILVLTNGASAGVNFNVSVTGVLLALAAAIIWAVFSIVGSGIQISPLTASALYNVISLLLSAIALFSFSRFVLPAWGALAGLFWIGAMTVAVPYWLWFTLIKKLGVDKMAVFSYLTPFTTLLFIALLLHEGISFGHIIGLIVIIAGCLIESNAVMSVFNRLKKKDGNSGIKLYKPESGHDVEQRKKQA